MIREQALKYLQEEGAKPGETVQFSWFVFRLAETDGVLDIETLDFRDNASFIKDFELVEQIHAAQMQVLLEAEVAPAFCNLRQCAVVSKSYAAGSPKAFLHRMAESEGSSSGWYLGVVDDPLDVDDQANLNIKSLYEIAMRDRRMLPYWLLPPGFRIIFGGAEPEVLSPET